MLGTHHLFHEDMSQPTPLLPFLASFYFCGSLSFLIMPQLTFMSFEGGGLVTQRVSHAYMRMCVWGHLKDCWQLTSGYTTEEIVTLQ